MIPAAAAQGVWDRSWQPWTSDSFAADSTQLIGRTTDAALGGTAQTWALLFGGAGASQISASGGEMWRGDGVTSTPGSYAATLAPGPDHAITFKMVRYTVAGTWRFASRITGTTTYYSLTLSSGGSVMRLHKAVAGSTFVLTNTFPVALGDTVGISARGDRIGLLKNGVTLVSVVDTELANDRCGVVTGGGVHGWAVDDVKVYVPAAA